MRTAAIRSLLFLFVLLSFSHGAFAQVGISVGFGPPAIPVYAQPICPADGYLWVPGYWSYDVAYGYYWVPGTWVQPPEVGLLWTPGYWGWGGSSLVFYPGYWGPQVGYYGGINYGFGYGGVGYEGGRWEGGYFAYNTYVNRVNTAVIHSTYSTAVTNVSENRISYNGGTGGVEAHPTPEQESYANERHVGPVTAQMQHLEEARNNPELRASANQGKPPIAATVKPGDFKTGVVASSEASGAYEASLPDAPIHANQLQAHKFTLPNTGDAVTDKEYQQQQSKLAARQAQDHQELEQQQEKEHQQAVEKNYSDAQKQLMEQRHNQQTQQLEQEHAAQQRQMEQRQAPRQPATKPEPH